MRIRVVTSFLVALAGAVVLYESLQARESEIRRQVLQSAAAVGSPAVSPRTPADAHLAALAAFRAHRSHRAEKATGPRAARIATAQQAIQRALAARQPAAQRSQLENLAGTLEQELASLGGDQVSSHERAAAHWLQRAVLDDATNADAKYNLELLISHDPKAARKQPERAPGKGDKETNGKPKASSKLPKGRSPGSRALGEGF
jgi:apolipoprotein N-acyltransferase